MSARRPARPGGWPPPDRGRLAGAEIELAPIAAAVSERYFERYPGDLERYGELAREWEIHDTQHLLNWAIGDVEGHVDLEKQAGWLAGILEARDFPLEHLAGNLEIAGDLVDERLGASDVAGRLRAAAAFVRGRRTFLDQ
jgi:hypothetical protein